MKTIGQRQELRIEGTIEPLSHNTDAVRFGDLLCLSGRAPFDSEWEVVGSGADARLAANFIGVNALAVSTLSIGIGAVAGLPSRLNEEVGGR